MKRISILIADDHAIVRMGLSTLLGAQEGFEVVGEATNGEQAIARALKLRPDVIVMDLVMPKKDGVAATAELREKLPTAKCLILTSFGTSEELKKLVVDDTDSITLEEVFLTLTGKKLRDI